MKLIRNTEFLIRKRIICVLKIFVSVVFVFLSINSFAASIANRNLPSECASPENKCGCSCKKVSADCIKVNIDLGVTTPWTDSLSCSLKIFADDDSPSIFTLESLYAVLSGYTFKRVGLSNLSDGETPAEVVMSHPNGEAVHFIFKDGESIARPDPGVHIKMDERLMMVDAQGWATTKEPVYYDLYVGDGSRRRFLATNMTGVLGELISITTSRGVTMTPADMGIDIVYDSNGVRQFLTPSRLADVTLHSGFTGYDVKVYALTEKPVKEAGLYIVPSSQPVECVSVCRENDGRRAVVTLQNGGGEPLRYIFDYAMRDWSLTHSSGMEERKECFIDDERAAQVVKTDISQSGEVLAKAVKNYKWESWGFTMTNRVEGFGGVTDTTLWTYYTSGNGKGQVKTEKRQSGLLIEYKYDSADRIISEKRSGPDMMTEVTTYDYTPVDPSDPALPVDTRPRTIVKTLNGIECERIYYVYAPLTNIIERVGTQGAAYGGTNVLRTVVAYYPVVANDFRSGKVKSRRHEDGKIDLYDYSLNGGVWTKTVTHLHEQSPAPVSGKTTRDITLTNARGEIIETRSEVYINKAWHVIARERMTYNLEGKRIKRENLTGQVTTMLWDCCHKILETQPDGLTSIWDYDEEGRMTASSRLIPLDMTNVTWLTTCYEYDDLGRQIATWQTNRTAMVGLPATRTRYDALGRVVARVDQLGNTTTTSYSNDGRIVSVENPNTSTRVITRSADDDMLSITGTSVTPEFHTYGILPDGTRWYKTVQGEIDASPRFTKRYENMLGQIAKEERSGFKGAVLATAHSYDSFGRIVSTVADYEPTTEYTYDTLGNRIATRKMVGRVVPNAPQLLADEWRKTETLTSFVLDDATVWLTQTNIVSCSDFAIAPLITSSSRQLTGLTQTLPARSRTMDIRGNLTENELLVDSPFVTSQQIVPYATNKHQTTSCYGIELQTVSVSAVTNTIAYDSLGRHIAHTDGRGNARHTEYNSVGQTSASIDALGNRTSYAYDRFGNLAAVTNPLGNAVVYEYDLRGRKTYEGGATYPVRYTYDVFGNKSTMMTYRDESKGCDSGDVTTWLYDEASGAMTNKVYADGKGPKYDYTPDGKLAQRVWVRGIATDYAYDGWGNLTNTVYSDNTPTVSLVYDVLGRQIEAHDAAGVTTFLYDSFGSLTNETVIGVACTNSIVRYWDDYGRTVGYSFNGIRQTIIGYEPDKGRISTMGIENIHSTTNHSNSCSWTYLPGSDLKSSLSYPNGLTASWQYDAAGQLLKVCNTTSTNVISQYDYTYDIAGRRVQISRSGSAMSETRTDEYGYNIRGELISAAKNTEDAKIIEYQYQYDDIGNRITSLDLGTNRTYVANNLNQYTSISNSAISASPREAFTPQFDDDGNQTLVQTATGIWQVIYNGENRPVLWERLSTNSPTHNSSTPTLISMSYDRMGRRVTKNNQRYVYNSYLQIADNRGNTYVWDPTEPVKTRPLVWSHLTFQPFNSSIFYYSHDGNKNVSEVVESDVTLVAHYEYAPFGAVTATDWSIVVTTYDFSEDNLFRFSSEYVDDALGLVYYNYRHYIFENGRFIGRDLCLEYAFKTLNDLKFEDVYFDYLFLNNNATKKVDYLGLHTVADCEYEYELCNEQCRRIPNYKRKERMLCWTSCNLKYSGCLATATETLVTAGVACFCALVAIATDGVAIPFLIGL